MMFRKIAGPMRIEDEAGSIQSYRLDPSRGGAMCKTLQYMVKVIKSSPTNISIGVEVEHGPDGDVWTELDQNLISMTPVDASSNAALLEGHVGEDDGSATKVVGEWIRPTIRIQRTGGSGSVWALVEIFEMRKPF